MAAERQRYLFLFRGSGGEHRIVRHDCRPGDAEIQARRMARLVAREMRCDRVECIWMGPARGQIPAEIRREIGHEMDPDV